jgi:hypothetical protein
MGFNKEWNYDWAVLELDRNIGINIMPGQSGSPIFLCSEPEYVRAIVPFMYDGHNFAPIINRDRFNAIVQFKRDHANDPVL